MKASVRKKNVFTCVQKKRPCERRDGQDMKSNNTCAPAAFDSKRLHRRPAAVTTVCSQREFKNQQVKQNQCDCLATRVPPPKTMARAQSDPLLALLFLRSSHSDDWLPQLFWNVQCCFVETKSPFLLSTSSCSCRRWTCDGRWSKGSTNTHEATTWLLQWLSVQSQWLYDSWSVGPPSPMSSLFLGITKSAAKGARKICVCKNHKARLGRADGIRHKNDELLRREPADAAHRQPEAAPEEWKSSV